MSSPQDTSDDRESRNAVFGNLPTMSREEMAKKEMGVELAINAVPLPSAGKVYPAGHPLAGSASVEYRTMTPREEDILMNESLLKKGTVITELIKSCLTDPKIDVGGLLSGDRNALMIAIRSSGYGEKYFPTYQCPGCKFSQKMDVDLSGLGIKSLSIDPVEAGTNLFKFDLPSGKHSVTFKFLTGRDEEEILAEAEHRKKKGIAQSSLVTSRLMKTIVAVNGDSSRGMIAKFVQIMPARDSLALRTFIDDNEPGVDMTVPFSCTNCGHEEEVSLPLGASFFWPNAKR